MTLPVQAEPLALAAALKGAALVKHRLGGLTTMLADWIGSRLQTMWDRLGGEPTARPALRRKKVNAQEPELHRLRADNARLKRQMDALLAQSPRPVSKAPSPT